MTDSSGNVAFCEATGAQFDAASDEPMVSSCPHTEPYQVWSKLYDPPFQMVDGEIHIVDEPGLGLTFNKDFIEAHRA